MEPPREAVLKSWPLLGLGYERGTAVGGLSGGRWGRRVEPFWLLSLRVKAWVSGDRGEGGEGLGEDGEVSRLHGVLYGRGRV
jgi:hypothetical protein